VPTPASTDCPAPTGTAGADLLGLELSEPAQAEPGVSVEPWDGPTTARVDEPPTLFDLPWNAGESIVISGTAEPAPTTDRLLDEFLLDHLDQRMIEFVGRMPTAFVAGADETGECDWSLRHGEPGFLRVLDERRLAYPEPATDAAGPTAVGILLVEPGAGGATGLHVRGAARRPAPAELTELAGPDRPAADPAAWVVVDVAEAYLHHGGPAPISARPARTGPTTPIWQPPR
jgi:hypothetical protein